MNTTAGNTTKSKSDILGISVFSAICLSTFGLGVWQVKRYYWKIDLIESIKQASHEEPGVLKSSTVQASSSGRLDGLDGKVMTITGHFDHGSELTLGPRSAPVSLLGYAAQGMATNPQGYYIITPFIIEDGEDQCKDTVIFVNRGWVPKSEVNYDRPSGSTTISCVIGNEEKAGTFAPKNDPKSKNLLWLERKAILNGTTMTSLDYPAVLAECVNENEEEKTADKTPFDKKQKSGVVQKFPFAKHLSDLQDQYVTPSTHIVYAVTWFSLAVAGCLMTYSKFKGNSRIARAIRTKK